MKRLKDKVVIITGAAQGMGKMHAEKALNEGAKVVITDINKELGLQTSQTLGENAIFIQHDVANEEHWSNVISTVIEKWGRIDVLVNNAGITYSTPLEKLSLAAYMIVTFLTVVLGNIGKFLAIILLILQLGSSEGTFPIQLSGKFFQDLHPFSPMSYVIKALRENIFNFTSDVTYLQSMLIIGSIAIVFALLSMLVYTIRSKYPNFRRKANENDY